MADPHADPHAKKPLLGLAPHGVTAPHAHVLPKSVYYIVISILLFLTVVTVLTAHVDLGVFNLPLAMVIASTKAVLVLAVFMHLWWDSKFNVMLFVVSLLFLGVFVVLTMLDTNARDLVDPQRANYLPRDEKLNAAIEAGESPILRPGQPAGKTDWQKFHEEHVKKHGNSGSH
jgi:cytochrome c oxidase subunit IV